MTAPELEGFLKQADMIEAGRTAPIVVPPAVASQAVKPAVSGTTHTFISKRKK